MTFLTRLARVCVAGLFVGPLVPVLTAQNSTDASGAARQTPPPPVADQVVELTPFEVRAERDDTYHALESNSVTRFRTELYKLPVTAEIFTEAFMRDVAATSVEDMVMKYGGASVISQDAGASASFNNQPGDRNGSLGTPTTIIIRGLPASVHRDGFITTAPTTFGTTGISDAFSTDRVDVTSGGHSLLYGNSGGGGVINIVSKQARFRQRSFEAGYRIDQYGSRRATFDVGYGTKSVALRFAAVESYTKYRRVNLGGPLHGLYAQLAFRLPWKTTLRISHQSTNSFMTAASSNGQINDFLPLTDPRRDFNLNYLVATNQVSDLNVHFLPGFDLMNIDSFKGWWNGGSTWAKDDYTNILVETQILPWLSSQLSFAYDDAMADSAAGASNLRPGTTTGNPFGVTAVQHTGIGDSLSHTRIRGWRWSLLATNEFGGGKIRSQTLVGGEATGRDGGQNGVAYSYYLLNADGSTFVNSAALNNGEYGRTRLTTSPTLWWPVYNGLVKEPLFRPMTPIIQAINPATGTMATWGRQQRRRLNSALVSPNNPLGADRTGSGEFNVGHSRAHAYTLANVTDWFHGKVQTLAGARWVSSYDLNIGPTAMTRLPKTRKITYSAGISYQLLSWLRPFADVSSAYNPSSQPNDPLGSPVKPPEGSAFVPDVGFKFQLFEGRVNGTVTYVPQNTIKNDRANIDNTYRDAINPDGVNGRFLGTGGTFQGTVNNDKESQSLDVTITASLTRTWRTRFGFHYTDGRFLKTVTYPQVYNDQFHVNSLGQVTYGAGGPTVQVLGNAVVTSGGSPLTLTMINDPSNPFYANPQPDSGRITSTALRTALQTVGPNGATAATGVVGLPISDIQYAWGDPNGHGGFIRPIVEGDKTIGYPRYSFSFTNRYEIPGGRLKGLSFIQSVNGAFEYRSHYFPVYGPGQVPGVTPFNQLRRKLYTRPSVVTVDFGFGYSRKFGRVTWSTQINIQNAFNQYRLLFPQNPTSTTRPFNAYVMTAQPRLWVWSNSVAF